MDETTNNGVQETQLIPYYKHPHVATYINDYTWYTEDVAVPDSGDKPFSTVVVTGADTGIDNTFVKMNDLETKQAIFGRGDFAKYGQPSLEADAMFDGNTSVWFCRVLPDNATYANVVLLAHYRVGNVLNSVSQENGLKKLEIKFSSINIDTALTESGAVDDDAILETAISEAAKLNGTGSRDGYRVVPLCYVRSSGRGKYGNHYGLILRRDPDGEKEYAAKMYKWGLVNNQSGVTRVTNVYSGAFYQTTRYNVSTLISDVLDQFDTGICPIYVKSFEDNFDEIYNAYMDIVDSNAKYINSLDNPTKQQLDDLTYASNIKEAQFDPLFGYKLLTKTDELIPYYQNYTMPDTGLYAKSDRTVTEDIYMPKTVSDWPSVEVGMTVRVRHELGNTPLVITSSMDYEDVQLRAEHLHTLGYANDENFMFWAELSDIMNQCANSKIPQYVEEFKQKWLEKTGITWDQHIRGEYVTVYPPKYIPAARYTVVSIKGEEIVYDEGVNLPADIDEFDGLDITDARGIAFTGGSDGDFESISVNGTQRAPTASEMKLLLAREQVKAFRGEKDRKILSPARTDLDFIFDANYNLTSNNELYIDDRIQDLYYNSTVLTDADYRELATLAPENTLDFTDLNVKKAMYDLVDFRNRNGMTIAEDMGAGCSLYLDCGIVGIKHFNASTELLDIFAMFTSFTGRACSIDVGSYDIYDPYTGKRITVTVSYFLAKRLVSHLMQYGLNKPFAMALAQIPAYQREQGLTNSDDMIRDTFKPDIDLIDWDVKEQLYEERFNYYLSTEEGRLVYRGTQNTRQMPDPELGDASACLEENNVRVLNTLKKGLEEACRSYLYNWNEPEARKGYTDAQMAIYRPWIGTMVQDIQIEFSSNEFEQRRMILHCYCTVAFRDIVKRVILEINIQRPEY